WLDHPLYRVEGQKILYRELGALTEAIEAAAAGDRSVGDFSRFTKLANHFEDQDAPKRVGEWVDDYMNRGGGLPALDAACAEYLRRHRVAPSFSAPGAWWGAAAEVTEKL
ncbi:MAG: hypothetical protein HY925_03720, partial [Elusimicrobia bacterium]|nr:hypothetical protein [Elusimicrobiota bacterium]